MSVSADTKAMIEAAILARRFDYGAANLCDPTTLMPLAAAQCIQDWRRAVDLHKREIADLEAAIDDGLRILIARLDI